MESERTRPRYMTVEITRSVIKSRLASLSLVGDEKGQQSVVIAHLALIPPRKMAGGVIFEGAELCSGRCCGRGHGLRCRKCESLETLFRNLLRLIN